MVEQSEFTAADAQDTHWDFVIIGTGIGGSTLGFALARQGHAVLFLERGLHSLGKTATGLSVASTKTPGRLRQGLWPEPFENRALLTNQRSEHPVGCGTGGSSAVFSMVMERFRPEDFTPKRFCPKVFDASVPESWPIGYDELAQHYKEAEALYRVRGTRDPLFPHGELLEPPQVTAKERVFLDGFRDSGLHPYRFHFACERVAGCDGCSVKLCMRDCRNDAHRACLRPALEKYGARLLPECTVKRLNSVKREVRGAICNYRGQSLEVHGRIFVLAANAYLTPRLLFESAAEHAPDGLANSSGLVGRQLMVHVSDQILVRPRASVPAREISHGIGLNDYYVVEGEKFGNVHAHPIELRTPPGFENPNGLLAFSTIVEDLPYARNRVLPKRGANDEVVYEYTITPELRRRSHELLSRFEGGIRDNFETRVLGAGNPTLNLSHPCGTCRFGDDPRASVLDRFNRAHDLSNLYVVDASFFPSSGGLNPSLTIAANALRVADYIGRCL